MRYKIKILPRWIVFVLDLVCIALSIFISFLLRLNFSLQDVAMFEMSAVIGTALLVNGILFYLLKSYAGIIRYTNIEDTFRLLVVNSIAGVIYFTANILFNQFINPAYHMKMMPASVIVINFFVTNFILISYRLLVRYCYKFYQLHQLTDRGDKIAAVIFDTGMHGQQTKKVINDFPNNQLQVVAFMDDRANAGGKQMEGISIYNTDDASFSRLQQDGVKVLIVANTNIGREKLNYLVEKSLNHGMKVQLVPPIDQWLNGTLDTMQLKDIRIEDLLEREVIKIENEQIHFELKSKKILVTGAAGSIGCELVRQLIHVKPSLIIMCDKAESPLHDLWMELQDKGLHHNVKPYIGDICDRTRMEHLFEIYKPDVVFHAAAYKHVPLMEENPSVAVLNNVLGTRVLAELAVLNDAEKFVMVSTDKAVNPTNIMGASKRIAEILTQSYYKHLAGTMEDEKPSVTKFVTTRFGNVLGSNGSVIPRFKKQLEEGGPITVTHPEITRYFMTIPEACQLVIEAGVMGQGGEIFVFDMGEPVKITDLARKMIMLAGKEPDTDIKIVFTGLRAGEKLYEELLNNAENTRPTYHSKILIADVREYDFNTVAKKLDILIASAQKHYTLETVGLMKELVPEFISKNSIFEKLDIKN